MTALKWITTEAKKIKKQHPHRFKKWTDYVAQASAIYASKHKGKSPVGKKHKVSGVKKKVVKKKVVKKSPVRSLHKDTKSHNVNIRVMSGIGDIGEHFTRVTNDVYGNPRYVIHFLDIINSEERLSIPFHKLYEYALKKAKKIGGKKFDNKSYGGGIVFQSYNIGDTWKKIETLKHTHPKIKI